MAGIYAHFIIAELASFSEDLEKQGFTPQKASLLEYSNFVLLGANSPDLPYPYKDNLWGDHMHYDKTGEFVSNAIGLLKNMSGIQKLKCQAWLMGYLSHLAADTVIHPVVNRIVVPYNVDPAPHQLCEKHQDAFAFHKLKVGETTKAEYISATIANCRNKNNDELDDDICSFWINILKMTFPDSEAPQPSAWFKRYVYLADKFGEEGGWFHVRALSEILGQEQLLQITYDQINRKNYIDELPSPEGFVSYEAVVNRAVGNTINAWVAAFKVLEGQTTDYPLFSNWNLDTGKNEEGEFLFWANKEACSEKPKIHNPSTTGLMSCFGTIGATLIAFVMLVLGMFSQPSTNMDPLEDAHSRLAVKVRSVSKILYSKSLKSPSLAMNNEQLQDLIKTATKFQPDFKALYLELSAAKGGLFYVWSSDKKELLFKDKIRTPELEPLEGSGK